LDSDVTSEFPYVASFFQGFLVQNYFELRI
jgi:hypothetical protein